MKNIGATIAKAQVTNGGPIILVQPENEYTQATSAIKPFPDPVYMSYVEDQLRKAGIVVPLISNDASAQGNNAPGKPAAVDIYGHDGKKTEYSLHQEHLTDHRMKGTRWVSIVPILIHGQTVSFQQTGSKFTNNKVQVRLTR